jgi:hypothetical protein
MEEQMETMPSLERGRPRKTPCPILLPASTARLVENHWARGHESNRAFGRILEAIGSVRGQTSVEHKAHGDSYLAVHELAGNDARFHWGNIVNIAKGTQAQVLPYEGASTYVWADIEEVLTFVPLGTANPEAIHAIEHGLERFDDRRPRLRLRLVTQPTTLPDRPANRRYRLRVTLNIVDFSCVF